MSTAVLPAVVLALAQQRLRDVVEALDRRPAADRTATETRVLALAGQALGVLRSGEPIRLPPTSRLAPGPSRAAVAGTLGFGLADQVDVFRGAGPWRGTALRTGTPDVDLGRVVVGTTQVALRVGELAARVSDAKAKAAVRAFSLGMLATVAADVVVNPVLRGLQARLSTQDWRPGLPGADVDAATRRAARLLTGTDETAWTGWWPAPSELPDDVLRAWLDAVDEVYALDRQRPKGFEAFETAFSPTAPLDLARARAAYEQARTAASAGWGGVGWFFAVAPFFVMPSIAALVARALPHGGAFFGNAAIDERSVFEVLTLGTALGGVAPAVWSMGLWTQVPDHASVFVNALVLAVVRAATGVAFGVTTDDDASPEVRWLLMGAPQLATDAYALVRWILASGPGHRGERFVYALNTIPAATGLVTLGLAALARALDNDGIWWLIYALVTAGGLFGGALPLALSLAGRSPLSFFEEGPAPNLLGGAASAAAAGGPADPAAPALLFDDSTLWASTATPTLADLAYPAGTRPVVRVWYDGPGTLRIGHDGHRVVLQHDGDPPVAVTVPPGGHTAAQLAAAITGAGLAGVHAEAVDTDPTHLYVLPYPATLADPGDSRATRSEHDAHAADTETVGGSRDKAYLLRHTPRVELATPYALDGPSASPLERIPVVPVTTLGGAEGTALGAAADLAALLMLGAAPSLADPGALPNDLHPVYQVFRQWNLDDRRVNEWRMLISGGALSEKAGNPAAHDPAMRPVRTGETFTPSPAAASGEPIANGLGWVRAWRAWARVAGDPLARTDGRAAEPYSPSVLRADGTRTAATNEELTAAVRFLLDLP